MPSTPRKSDRTPILSSSTERAFPFSDYLTTPVYSTPRQVPQTYLHVEWDDQDDDDDDDQFAGPAPAWPYDSNFPGQYSPFLVHKTFRGPGGRRLNSPAPRIDTTVGRDDETVAPTSIHPDSVIYHHEHSDVPTLTSSGSTHASTSLASASFHSSRGRGIASRRTQQSGSQTKKPSQSGWRYNDIIQEDIDDDDDGDNEIWIETAHYPGNSDQSTIQEQIATPELSETGTIVAGDISLQDLCLNAQYGLRSKPDRAGHAVVHQEVQRGRTLDRKRSSRRGRHIVRDQTDL